MVVLKGHSDYINSLAYEPDKGDLIVSCSDDQTGKLWDLETGQAVHTFHLTSPGDPKLRAFDVRRFKENLLL